MKAIVWTKYGPPNLLKLEEVERPEPKENEVLIRVHAATVNRTDCSMLRASPFIMRFLTGILKPVNPILETDFASKVEEVGKNMNSFKVGDNVFGFEDTGLSSHAEYLKLPEDKALTTMPDNLTYEQATASLEGAHYAYNMINKVDLTTGQKVLVNGASGGIGSAAVQLLKYLGADVTAVCATENVALVKSLGATKVFEYDKEDFTQTSEKYTFVFDTVGKSTFAKCKPLLDSSGAYISSELGPWAQNLFFALTTRIVGDSKVIFPIPLDCKRSVLLVKKLIEEGKFKAVIDRTYPMGKITDAFRYVETGQKIGNVVITFAG